MSTTRSLFHASLAAWWCCPECDAALLFCPSCREQLPIRRPKKQPPALPYSVFIHCPDAECGAALAITVCGYKPNPTGDAPAYSSLSDRLPVAPRPGPARPERRRKPAATRPTPQRPAAPALRSTKPSGPSAPCPPDAERYRLAHWATQGLVPEALTPSTVAAAYRRAFWAEPHRDGGLLVYSRRELGLALAELGLEVQP